MLLHRSGAVSPAVLFLSGAGLIGLNCFNIQDEISHRTTSILYDRSGTGWIDDIPLPGTAGEVAEELRTLLNARKCHLLTCSSLTRWPKPTLAATPSSSRVNGIRSFNSEA